MVPTVSVVVASYNYAQYIGDCLESILSQTFSDFEVIVVDDGSTDNSLDILYRIGQRDKRIRIYQHPDKRNHGLIQTIVYGISLCRGKYIAFLESDDKWDKNCLVTRIAALKNFEGCKLIFNNVNLIVEKNAKKDWYENNISALMKSNEYLGYEKNSPVPFDCSKQMLIENRIPTFSCVMVSRDLLSDLSFDSPVQKWVDWWLWIQASHLTKFLYISDKLTYWRIHDDSFNHKSTLSSYLRNNRLMWRGFRVLQIEDRGCILSFPSFFRILSRLVINFRRLGLRKTVGLVFDKFMG